MGIATKIINTLLHLLAGFILGIMTLGVFVVYYEGVYLYDSEIVNILAVILLYYGAIWFFGIANIITVACQKIVTRTKWINFGVVTFISTVMLVWMIIALVGYSKESIDLFADNAMFMDYETAKSALIGLNIYVVVTHLILLGFMISPFIISAVGKKAYLATQGANEQNFYAQQSQMNNFTNQNAGAQQSQMNNFANQNAGVEQPQFGNAQPDLNNPPVEEQKATDDNSPFNS